MSTVSDLCQSALEDLGVLGAGETMASQDLDTCFKSLNQLMDSWAAQRLTIYTVTATTWTIVSGTGQYTVGTGGDVNVARPEYVQGVSFTDSSTSPVLELPLARYTDIGWSRIALKTLTSTLPTGFYYNYVYPLATIDLWPVPTSSTLSGVMYAPQATAQFAATSTTVALPPGYERFIVKNLAMEVAAKFGAIPSPGIIQAAMRSMAVIKAANNRASDMSMPAGALIQSGRSGSYYAFLSGTL